MLFPRHRPIDAPLDPEVVAPRTRPGFLERLQAAHRALTVVDSSRAQGLQESELFEGFADLNRRIFQATGTKLHNPFQRAGGREALGVTPRPELLRTSEFANPAQALEAYRERLATLRAARPDGLEGIESPDEVIGRVNADIKRRAELPGELSELVDGVDAARIVGTLTGAVADPLVLMTLFAGAPASAGIGRTMLIEGLLGGAIELPIQVDAQRVRQDVGLPHGPEEVLKNVGIAAAGSGLLAGGVKGLATGIRKLKPNPRPADEAVIRELEDAADIGDALDPSSAGSKPRFKLIGHDESGKPRLKLLGDNARRLQRSIDNLTGREDPALRDVPSGVADDAELGVPERVPESIDDVLERADEDMVDELTTQIESEFEGRMDELVDTDDLDATGRAVQTTPRKMLDDIAERRRVADEVLDCVARVAEAQ